MTIKQRRPPIIDLTGGNVSLDFVNTLDDRYTADPKEILKNYADLLRFAADTGVLTAEECRKLLAKAESAPAEAEQALQSARDLREALHEIFAAAISGHDAAPAAMNALNATLREASLHEWLVPAKDRWEWRFDDLTSTLSALLWPLAREAARLLASGQIALVRACDSPTCRWFFLDTSKNHRRRWCDMTKCGNREKAKNFYARKKSTTDTEGKRSRRP